MRFSGIRTTTVFVLLALTGLGSCAQIEQKGRAVKLEQAVRLYVDSIRWGNFETAAGLVRPRAGTAAAPRQVPANVRVTAYASRIVSINETRDEAQVITAFDYYFQNSATVNSVSRQDLWWYDPNSEQWYLDGSLPEFKR